MRAGHRFLLTRMPGAYFHLRNLGRKAVGTRRRQRRLFADLVGPGDLVVDVGANIGEFTAAFRDLGARVVAVEPQPRLAAHLRRRFRGDPRVTVVETALSDRTGTATLFCTTADALATLEEVRATSRTGPGGELEWGGTMTVPLRTLDALVAEHGTPALVKVDVEGHELRVLSGLASARPTVLFEVNRPWAGEVLELLHGRGYTDFYLRLGERGDWLSRSPVPAPAMRDRLARTADACDCLAVAPGGRRPAGPGRPVPTAS